MAALMDIAAVSSLGGKGSRPLGPFSLWREQGTRSGSETP